MWVGLKERDSSRLDEIDPESRLLLEAALANRAGNTTELENKEVYSPLPEIPRVDVPEVTRFVSYYSTGPGRLIVAEGMGRRAVYAPQISKILAEYGLPQELVNIPLIESRYLAHARSPMGAVGMWQLMQATARQYGLTISFFSDERTDVERSTRAVAMHMRELYDIFEDWHLALAAYNCGVGRVQEAVKQAGTRDFFEVARRGYLPKETQDYVPKLLALGKVVDQLDTSGVALNRIQVKQEG